ncbi:ribonuclease [thermophilic bacterium 2918]|uniref:Ribonuclease n=2 Tax=Thermogemmata fonticola TaxID=2755323 RepID=A0A7V9AD35_9BACT|nr:ribonuclease [Thermogemmata fonticola]
MAMVPAGRQLVTTSETAVPRQPIVPSRTVRFVHGVTIKDIRTGKVLTGIVDLQLTLDRIRAGIRFPHCNDGGIFKNKPLPGKTTPELPVKPYGYYREYVPPTPGISGPGPQRLVVGQGGEIYYIPDHYRTFIRVD